MTYSAKVQAILNDFSNILASVSGVNQTNMGFYSRIDNYPACLFMPNIDEMKTVVTQTDHTVVLDLMIMARGNENTPNEDMNSFVSVIGSVWDKLELNRVNVPKWRDLQVRLIDYTFNRSKSLIFYIAHLSVRLTARW